MKSQKIISKNDVLNEREALLEMYKAGFLDGYKIKNKLKKHNDWITLNKFYKLAFMKRFEKKLNKVIKGK